jgi:hypothetical protein
MNIMKGSEIKDEEKPEMQKLEHSVRQVVLFGVLTLGLQQASAPKLAMALAPAATISFTSPAALQVTVGEGDDFATKVLGNPWDMNERRDIGYEIGFNNIAASGGNWQGTFSGIDQGSGAATTGYFFPLFQGFSSYVQGQWSDELMWNVVGARDPLAIDTSKYTLLSLQMYTGQRSHYAVYWTGAKPVTWPTSDHYFLARDGCNSGSGFVAWPNGWRTYFFDLAQTNGDAGAQRGTWQDQAKVRGLRIDPSSSAPTGTQVQVDWIRLTNPSTSPTINIQWNTTGADAGDVVDIWVAPDAAGTDAQSPLIRGIPATNGSYSFKTSILPPGQWYFKLYLMRYYDQRGNPLYQGCGTNAISATTGWTGPLTIVQAPVTQILAPSMTSGADYATTELGNPWDMRDSADIITPGAPYPQTLTNQTFSNSNFCATAKINPPQNESDAQIWLHTEPTSRPINTTKYRYFTARFKTNLPANKDISWAIRYGWGGRIIWWNNGINTDGSETKFGYWYEDWRNYTVDLGQAVPPPPLSSSPLSQDNILTPKEQNSYPAQLGWNPVNPLKYLRFDLLETTAEAVGTGADQFCIDWVRLTAQDQVTKGQPFAIHYTVSSTTPPATLSFFYTTDPNAPTQFSAQPYIPSSVSGSRVYMPLALRNYIYPPDYTPGGLAYLWDTSVVSPGTYYICAQATSTHNTTTNCSESPVIVSP